MIDFESRIRGVLVAISRATRIYSDVDGHAEYQIHSMGFDSKSEPYLFQFRIYHTIDDGASILESLISAEVGKRLKKRNPSKK